MNKKKIVILGGGFAGISTYLSLIKKLKPSEADILIINKTNYFLFTPLLHEVATGGLSEHNIVESVREIIYESGTNLLVADIIEVDMSKKIVHTTRGDVVYDYLVVALGAVTNFYNIPGAAEFSFILKDLSQAIILRNRCIAVFEEASHVADQRIRKKMLSFAIIGGGPTGVELAAEMADLFFDTFRMYYRNNICKEDVTLYLVSAGKELISMFDASLREKSLEVLREKGVRVLLNTQVHKITKDSIVFANNTSIPASQVVWAAGVKANGIRFVGAEADPPRIIERDPIGRIMVDEYGRPFGMKDVFALGDIAVFPAQNGVVLPMLAQVAVQQGKIIGRNVAATLHSESLSKFIYRSKGNIVSLGQWQAVGKVFGITWKGPLAWWLWRTVYLFNFSSWPKRIKIAIDWTINIFYPRDITKA